MNRGQPTLQLFLRRLRSHSALSPEEQHALLELPWHIRRVRRNEDFLAQDATADHACFVLAGLIGRFDQTPEGKRLITAFHFPGEAANLRSVVLPSLTPALQALSAATLGCVPHSALRQVARQFPGLAEAFWRDCAIDAAIVAEWMINIGRRTARTRIAHLLCETAVRLGVAPATGEISFPLTLTQVQLADATALTPVHVNRTLQALGRQGLGFLNGRGSPRSFIIPNWNALADAAEFDLSYLLPGEHSDQEPGADRVPHENSVSRLPFVTSSVQSRSPAPLCDTEPA